MSSVADEVRVTKSYREDRWIVSVEVLPTEGGVLPPDVFIHENTGTAQLGNYVGVCSREELQRLQKWTGSVLKKFGNRYVRYYKAEYALPPGVAPDQSLAIIKNNLASLRKSLLQNLDDTSILQIK